MSPDAGFSHPVSGLDLNFSGVPEKFPSAIATDAPLLGNGSFLVAVGGQPEQQLIYFSRNDFWRLEHAFERCFPLPVGRMALRAPALHGAETHTSQSLAKATTLTRHQTQEGSGLEVRSWVCAAEDLYVLEFTAMKEDLDVELSMIIDSNLKIRNNPKDLREEWKENPPQAVQSDNSLVHDEGTFLGRRVFQEQVGLRTEACLAWKVLGEVSYDVFERPQERLRHEEAGVRLTLPVGQRVTVAVASSSAFKSKQPMEDARQLVEGFAQGNRAELTRAHEAWWRNFWKQSLVEVDDPQLEKAYYRGLYTLGSVSRDPDFPPGLFGWVSDDMPRWNGDYHMNYNHMAPFYSLYSANRLEQARPHYAPIFDFMDRARGYAETVTQTRGVLYPVGIGPKGFSTSYRPHLQWFVEHGLEAEDVFLMQRSNAAYGLVNMATDWYTTRDPEWGRRIYTYALEVVSFWEDYLVWEPADEGPGRYIVLKDAIHEGSGSDKNAILSLGLVRSAFQLALELSDTLGEDPQRRKKWQYILDHLSEFPTQIREGKEVFRYTEEGTAWWDSNTLGIQHIYPAGQVHLDSPEEQLVVGRNTIDVMDRWIDFNGSTSFFMAAIRVGYSPEIILQKLRDYVAHCQENGFAVDNPHGIEACSVVPNALNEMLCMSHAGVLRFFPAWPKERDARFENLRAWGAFLVSSELKDGVVQNVKIKSERGRDCTVVNPWPGQQVRLIRGAQSEILSGDRFTFSTKSGEAVTMKVEAQ